MTEDSTGYDKYCKENDEEWEKEKKIKFSIPTAKDIPELKKYLIKEFFTSEPLCKNMIENGGWLSKKMARGPSADYICGSVKKIRHSPGCVIARSTDTGNIVGARIGKIVSKDDPVENERIDWAANLPKVVNIPYVLIFWGNLGPVMEELGFGAAYMFKQLPDAKMIYYCGLLSVSSEAQGKGLGTELFRRGYELAKQAGCEYTHTCATSDFTKKIIRKLGNETMTKEIRYEDIRRDKKGRPFFLDTGVHQSMQTFNVDHRSDK